ncbi:DeoR/GlpR family DNA-binding transcription regulator [Actinomadura hibisca]|uniref:DeoR/GlpR family DNA-binding transcription regulator n=1 Tax=Actinomadura hibisca TaxID=68565 RepID=UPI000835B6C0|nr:DeoR/GlpR family DNA-binding transcription regulator [Actinomadura hibisca]
MAGAGFPAARRRHILEAVRGKGWVALRELAATVGGSEATLRRDVRLLAAEGLLERTRGGVRLPATLAREASYQQKTQVAAEAKDAIAAAAARLVEDGDAIVLGPGTTTERLAAHLVVRRRLTVVTNSLPVAQTLAAASGVEVVMTGGVLRGSILALVGAAAEQSLAGLRVRAAFLSGNGLTAERGLSTPNMDVAVVDRALAAVATEVVVLADATKVGVEAVHPTVPPEAMAALVTDVPDGCPEVAALADRGVRVVTARPAEAIGSVVI